MMNDQMIEGMSKQISS